MMNDAIDESGLIDFVYILYSGTLFNGWRSSALSAHARYPVILEVQTLYSQGFQDTYHILDTKK